MRIILAVVLFVLAAAPVGAEGRAESPVAAALAVTMPVPDLTVREAPALGAEGRTESPLAAALAVTMPVPDLTVREAPALPAPERTPLRVAVAAAFQPTPEQRAEIENMRTVGLVKLIVGVLIVIPGASWTIVGLAAGPSYPVVAVGAGMAAGGYWLIRSGLNDRREATLMETQLASISVAPLPGGAVATYAMAW